MLFDVINVNEVNKNNAKISPFSGPCQRPQKEPILGHFWRGQKQAILGPFFEGPKNVDFKPILMVLLSSRYHV